MKLFTSNITIRILRLLSQETNIEEDDLNICFSNFQNPTRNHTRLLRHPLFQQSRPLKITSEAPRKQLYETKDSQDTELDADP